MQDEINTTYNTTTGKLTHCFSTAFCLKQKKKGDKIVLSAKGKEAIIAQFQFTQFKKFFVFEPPMLWQQRYDQI